MALDELSLRSERDMQKVWGRMCEAKRKRLIKELRSLGNQFYGDPEELCFIDDIDRLPSALQKILFECFDFNTFSPKEAINDAFGASAI